MSKELYKYTEPTTINQKNLLKAEVIDFPSEKKIKKLEEVTNKTYNTWNINDVANDDQLKAVTGISFMLITLIILGIYSYFF